MKLLLCIRDLHGMSRSNFEPLQRLKGCSCLHIIPKLYKRNAWFCFDHSYFFKAWELLEQKLDSQIICVMWQVLHKQDAVGWGRSLRHNRPGRLILWSLKEERKGTTAVRYLVFNAKNLKEIETKKSRNSKWTSRYT